MENPSISKLPEELGASCDSNVTFDKCGKIVGSFQTGKTPGNEGIPIEFYKTFWPLIGVFMIDSFIEAYDNKEMSSSQIKSLSLLSTSKRKTGIIQKIGDQYL